MSQTCRHAKNLKRPDVRRCKMQIGIIGLVVMGRNLSLPTADHDFSVAGYDKDPKLKR